MSLVLRLLFVSVMVFMVYTKDDIVDSEEIEMLQKKLCGKNEGVTPFVRILFGRIPLSRKFMYHLAEKF